MAFRIQSHFNFVATATLLLLTKSTTAIDSGVSTGHDVCKGLDGVTFNATGTIKTKAFPDFSKGPEGQIDLKEWTWHTGLDGTNLSSPEQYIWVDTTGSVDLNSPESPYNNTCMTAFALDPDADFWNTPQNDTGDCKSMLGADCLSALSSSFSGMTAGDCSGPSGLSNFDDCPILKSYSAMSVQFYPKVERNESCGSTQDNTDGSKSVFYSTGLENSEVTDFALYDKMAKVGHLLVAMPRYTNESSGTTQGEIRYMCMRNTDFAEGSRNPLPKDESQPSGTPTGTGGAPVPTGGAAKRSAGLASLTTAFFVGVFMLFN